MPSNPLTQSELNDYAIGRILTPSGELNPYMPSGYFLATHYSDDSPALWRLFDASYIRTGIIDPNRLGTGSTGAGSLYLADDGTWKLISTGGGGDMLKATYDVDNDGTVDSAERIEIVVRNSTGTTLTKGTVVYLSGATGNRPNAVRSQANSEATSSKTIGIVVADINNNSDGYVAVNGTLHNLDTSAFADGDAVWLSATTAGAYTSTIPAEPNHTVFIGYIARSHPTQGRLVILIQNGYELNELHGVQIASEANNDLLVYESSSTLWKNKSIATIFGGTPLIAVPTLDQVTTAGNTTTNAITVNKLTVTGTGEMYNMVVGSASDITNYNQFISTEGTGEYGIWNDSFYFQALGTLANGVRFITASNVVVLNMFQTANIGIGTTIDAGYKLDVNGTARIQSTLNVIGNASIGSTAIAANTSFQVNGGTTKCVNYNGYYSSGSFFTYQAFGSWEAYGADAATATILAIGGYRSSQWAGITFHSSGAERARITSSGNLLIGTTTDAGYKLDVNGTGRFTNNLLIVGGATGNPLDVKNSSSSSIFRIVANKDIVFDDYGQIYFYKATNILSTYGIGSDFNIRSGGDLNALWIKSNGNILMGTSTDSGYRLNVSGSLKAGTTSLGYTSAYAPGNTSLFVGTVASGNNTARIVLDPFDTDNSNYKIILEARYVSSQPFSLYTSNAQTWLYGYSSTMLYQPYAMKIPTQISMGTTSVGSNEIQGSVLFIHGEDYYAQQAFIRMTSYSTGISNTNGVVMGLWTSDHLRIWNYENKDLYFGTNNAERLRILANGNVLINTTTDSGYRLDVSGQTIVRDMLTLRGYTGGTVGSAVAGYTKSLLIGGTYNQGYNSGNAVILHIADYSNDGADNVYPIYCEDENNVVDFWINSGNTGDSTSKKAYFGGNVGIGITNPTNKLQVVGNIALSGNLVPTTGSQTLGTFTNRFTDVWAGGLIVGTTFYGDNYQTASGTMFFKDGGGVERMRMTSVGNFLIGTTIDPGYKLTVNGDINTSGIFRVGGVAGWTGTINCPTNPPGQQNIQVTGGIITNVF